MTAATARTHDTPRLRDLARRGRFWAVLGVVALAAAVILAITSSGSLVEKRPLAADSAAPSGAQALVRVLSDHGVAVSDPDGYDEADRQLRAHEATLVLVDGDGILSDVRLRALVAEAASVVWVEPTADALDALVDGVDYGAHDSEASAPLTADCAVPAAENAQTMTPGDKTLTADADAEGAVACFTNDDGAQLIVDGTTTLVADGTFLDNEHILSAGNAALALGLTSAQEHVVWYLPTLADANAGDTPTVQEITPDWVTPLVVLLFVAAAAAALWRGRRLGPLLAEDLPVTVPARETMEGRARLYARSSARLRALDSLRIGALGRLARHLGLARTANVEEIIAAAASLTGRHRDEVAGIVRDDRPHTDRELVDSAQRLSDLEEDVRRRTTPSVAPTDTNTEE